MTPSLALSGIWPRPEPLVKATWNFDKGLLTEGEVDRHRVEALEDLLRLQQRLNVEAYTDGQLTWQDAFRGLVESTTGLEAGGVVRLFETNRFYRQPILVDQTGFRAEAFQRHQLLERRAPPGPKKAILPSPYWLARAARVDAKLERPEEVLAGLVHEAAQWLEEHGYAQIQFQEPLLLYEDKPKLDEAARLLRIATAGLRTTTILNLPNGNAAPHWTFLTSLPVSRLGVDFVETHAGDLPSGQGRLHLQAAVVDSQESHLESEADVYATVEAVQRLRPASLQLTHTWDLEFLPASVAERKLERLAQAATRKVVA